MEKDFQNDLVKHLNENGWTVAHFTKAKVRPNKAITTVKYQGRGYPDLTCVHPEKGIVFIEVKTDTGVVSEVQQEWLDKLGQHCRVFVVYPSNFDELKRLL